MKMSTYCQSCSEPVKTPGFCRSCASEFHNQVPDPALQEDLDEYDAIDRALDIKDETGWERYRREYWEDVEREWETSMEPDFDDYPIYDEYPY
jgi:hypothetical protein